METTYTGKVYALDFVQSAGWFQAALRNGESDQNIVVITLDIRMQSILTTGLIMDHDVVVTYEKDNNKVNRLTQASINFG